ncbi:gamma-glutamyltranspeptidase/glutathione hydrolase [Enterovirga rhinocerotis]|uniref:Gamma-glutamyltranspeptidase/glutathione hydrolase n=2 Tax=Enterovirga rhinocerotis TaxID=1339210 RepID=A0A4R7C7I5_9HYPH|nr:gamma-glutamyltranspeptidase/glutathione hydrolase [Enterovirga rhinocerotis]
MDTPTFSTAAVAAPHRLAAASGRNVLAMGGNAIEAMVAMAATIAVVYPHMNAIGGDGFWVVREPGGRVRAIEACGPAGAKATIRRYRDLGYDSIPFRGADAAVTVAGTIGGWALALDYAKSLGGRLGLSDLLADAIRFAGEGCEVSASELRTEPNEKAALWAAPGFAGTYGFDGKAPKAGDIRRNPKLADTLSHLASAGLDDFYRGDVGREIGADLERLGMVVTREDYAAYRAVAREPLRARLNGATVYNMTPPTQGLAALLILGIYEKLGITGREGVRHHHGLIEATKRAFRIRDRVVTDHGRLKHDPQAFLTADVFAREAAVIDMARAAPFPSVSDPGDTIWMGASDASGLTVSFIQSVYWEWGSGCVLPGTGIVLQNRGASFSLDPAAVNPLELGRRPFHTLNPALAAFDDGRSMAYGSMGGDGQPQFQAQLYTRYADLGESLAAAVDSPRWLLGRTWGSTSTSLKLENRFDPEIVDGLLRLGHEVEVIGEAYSDGLGHAGMVVKYPKDGRVEAMHDPRSDGGAEGL